MKIVYLKFKLNKLVSFFLILFVAFFISSAVASSISAGTLTEEDDVQVNATVSDCTIRIRVYPEKRIPPVNNWGGNLTVTILDTSNGFIFSTAITSDNQGFGQREVCSLGYTPVPGNYNFRVRGHAHLWKQYNNISAFQSLGNTIDLTSFPPLLAGETSIVLDNFVNGLDLSTQAKVFLSGDFQNDLNRDGQVNTLDFSISIANLYKFGD